MALLYKPVTNYDAYFDFKGSCSSSQFQCHTGECISSSKVCDLNKDCRDSGSDETGCGMDVLVHLSKSEPK